LSSADRTAAMQRTGVQHAVFSAVREIDGIAPPRQYVDADLRKHGRAAGLDIVQVHDKSRDALTALSQHLLVAGLLGVEVIEVRLVLATGFIVQDLDRLAVLERKLHEFGDALLDAQDQVVLAAVEIRAVAGAVRMDVV